MNTKTTINNVHELLDFCCTSSNTPLVIEDYHQLGKISIGMDGWYNPNDGDLISLLCIAFARYFHGFRADVNIGTEESGYYRFSARMTLRRPKESQ